VGKFCVTAILCVALSALGQTPENRYNALKQALRLSDAQLSQLRQRDPAVIAIDQRSPVDAEHLRDRMLDDAQRTKLAAIQKVLDRWDAAALALEFGLIGETQWPGGTLCFYPVRAYAYAQELGLSDTQVQQLEQLAQTAVPSHALALAVLDDTQKAKLAAFRTALQLASEAIELRLIPAPAKGEILCH